ncbi:hypothetical protein KKD19_04035 [Patescibacteria group bacterium]|nr:hypothetical protein [Patescibacteria group bacterium]MBU4512376.1 hypothetical protein [Patescibacteria group bacterium]
MKYLLFVNFGSGLMHNAIHETLRDALESIKQLISNEGLDLKNEKLLNVCGLKKYLNKCDDCFGRLSNGTWFHIQPQNIFEIVK